MDEHNCGILFIIRSSHLRVYGRAGGTKFAICGFCVIQKTIKCTFGGTFAVLEISIFPKKKLQHGMRRRSAERCRLNSEQGENSTKQPMLIIYTNGNRCDLAACTRSCKNVNLFKSTGWRIFLMNRQSGRGSMVQREKNAVHLLLSMFRCFSCVSHIFARSLSPHSGQWKSIFPSFECTLFSFRLRVVFSLLSLLLLFFFLAHFVWYCGFRWNLDQSTWYDMLWVTMTL